MYDKQLVICVLAGDLPEHTYHEDMFLPKQLPSGHLQYDTLREALVAMASEVDCGGVTLVNGKYELRVGPRLVKSRYHETSWVPRRPRYTVIR